MPYGLFVSWKITYIIKYFLGKSFTGTYYPLFGVTWVRYPSNVSLNFLSNVSLNFLNMTPLLTERIMIEEATKGGGLNILADGRVGDHKQWKTREWWERGRMLQMVTNGRDRSLAWMGAQDASWLKGRGTNSGKKGGVANGGRLNMEEATPN